jgi:hypothetical protein
VKSTFRRATSLTEEELRALWRFRLGLINLKPTIPPEEDFAAFAADFQTQGFAWILREDERVAGFFLQRALPLDWEGRRLLCLLPEYGFLAPHLRGHPILPLATLYTTLLCVGDDPLRARYVAASAYPPAYIAFRRVFRVFWTLRDPDLPPWERGLLLHLAERLAGEKLRREDGTVEMRTIPIVAREPGSAGSADSRQLYEDYVAANPDWRGGRGLFFLMPLDGGQLARVLLHAGERILRRRRA